MLAASKASIAPPPCCQAAGGPSFGVKVPVQNRRTKSVTPEASDDIEDEGEEPEMEPELEPEIPVADKNKGRNFHYGLQLFC